MNSDLGLGPWISIFNIWFIIMKRYLPLSLPPFFLSGNLCFIIAVIFCFITPPSVLADEPLKVQVGIKLHQITSINQKEENFSAVTTLIMQWHEPALALDSGSENNPRMYEGGKFIQLMTDKELLWPAISFYNAQGRIAYQNRLVAVDPAGNVSYFTRFTATFQAPEFDFREFPFDTQRFNIILDSVLPLRKVIFGELEGFSKIGDALGEEEWIIGNAQTELTEHDEIFFKSTRFIFSFKGERHINYYLVRIFVPTIIIILVSWFTFFLKDYGKRIDIASGNLLLFIAFSFTIANDLPRLGYLTLMDLFLLATFIITGLVVLANVVMKRLQRIEKNEMINRIDTIGIWGYPVFYLGAGLLVMLLFYIR